MTQAELAQMTPMMGGGYNNPLEMAALTQGNMGYLPNAQMMTPSSMGAFRSMPDMAYQQPVNQQAGYLKSVGMAKLSSYGFGYNPAVNPLLQRVEAERLVHDTNTSTWGALGGTIADFAIPGLAFKVGSALKKVGKPLGIFGSPLRFAGGLLGPAAMIAQMAISSMLEGPQEKIANARALQRLTRGKIVSGAALDEGMMSGFSTRAAREIDRHIFRLGTDDSTYDREDYRRMLNEGVQAGLFDYANDPEQYKKVLRNIRDNMSTVMEVTGSQDFKDVMNEMKRLQDMGATQNNYKAILRKENMYARITGMNHSDLVNMYGQMGALEFNQRGLNQMAGSQLAMHNAAVVTMMQRNGTLSNVQLANNGGVSGLAQKMTSQEADARAQYEKAAVLALYDPETGKLRKDAKERFQKYFNSGKDGLRMLTGDAQRNKTIIAQKGPEALQNYERAFADNANSFWTSTARSPEEITGMMHMIVGRASGAKTNESAYILGARGMGMDAVSADTSLRGMRAMVAQRAQEKKLENERRVNDFNKQYNVFSRAWRSVKRWGTSFFNDNIDDYVDSRLNEGEATTMSYAQRYNRGLSSTMQTLIANNEARKNKQKNADDAVQKAVDAFSKSSTTVTLGDSVTGLDMTPMLSKLMKQIVVATNKELGYGFYTKEFERILNSSSDGVHLKQALEKAGKTQAQLISKHTKLSDISKRGTVFFDKNGNAIGASLGNGKVATLDDQGNKVITDVKTFAQKNTDASYISTEDVNEKTGGGAEGFDIFNEGETKAQATTFKSTEIYQYTPPTGSSYDYSKLFNNNNGDAITNGIIIQDRVKRGSKSNFDNVRKAYADFGVDIGTFDEFNKYLQEHAEEFKDIPAEKLGAAVQDAFVDYANKHAKGADGTAVDIKKLHEANEAFVNTPNASFYATAAVLSNDIMKNNKVATAAKDSNKLTGIANIGNQTGLWLKDITVNEKQQENYALMNAVEQGDIEGSIIEAKDAISKALGGDAILPVGTQDIKDFTKQRVVDGTMDDVDAQSEEVLKDYLSKVRTKDGKELNDDQIDALLNNKDVRNAFRRSAYVQLGKNSRAVKDVGTEAFIENGLGKTLAKTSAEYADTLHAEEAVLDTTGRGALHDLTENAVNNGASAKSVKFANLVAVTKKQSSLAKSDSDREEIDERVDLISQQFRLSDDKKAALKKYLSDQGTDEDLNTVFGSNQKALDYYKKAQGIVNDSTFNRSGLSESRVSLYNVSKLSDENVQKMLAMQTVDQAVRAGATYDNKSGTLSIKAADINTKALSDENKKWVTEHTKNGLLTSGVSDISKFQTAWGNYQRVLEESKPERNILDATVGTADITVDGMNTLVDNTNNMKESLDAIKQNTTGTPTKIWNAVFNSSEAAKNKITVNGSR